MRISAARSRTAIVAAHPDDETLGAGACLQWLHAPAIIHVTDGAPRDMRDAGENGFTSRQEYAQARQREFLECLRKGGIKPADTVSLGYVDQEASLHLVELAREILRLIQRLKIEMIFTHPYEGGHPDHDAAAFAVHAACLRLPPAARPSVIEFTSYHGRDGRMETGVFLPDGESRQLVMKLDAAARARKLHMLACYRTQQKVVRCFSAAEERFRPAPVYNFTAPPHAGPLFYEQLGFGMTAACWRELARAALQELALE
jgi:LmbE family N-acetylglucosaminyl deacetylase